MGPTTVGSCLLGAINAFSGKQPPQTDRFWDDIRVAWCSKQHGTTVSGAYLQKHNPVDYDNIGEGWSKTGTVGVLTDDGGKYCPLSKVRLSLLHQQHTVYVNVVRVFRT